MLRIATLTNSPVKDGELAELVTSAGHQLVGHWQPSTLNQIANPQCDAWIVDCDGDLDDPCLDNFLNEKITPVIFCDATQNQGSAEHQAHYKKTLREKLEQLGGIIALRSHRPATHVCLIGASTGGIEPVREFLSKLPAQLDLCILYAQHIDAAQLVALSKRVSVNGRTAKVIEHHEVLAANQLLLVRPEYGLVIQPNATASLTPDVPWHGLYSPSISQLAFNLSRRYKHKFGMVIFSGLDDDGSHAVRFITQNGGWVMAQDPNTATSASMPNACINTGATEFVGNAEQLARAVLSKYDSSVQSR